MRPAQRSDTMSPYRFGITRTSKRVGSRTWGQRPRGEAGGQSSRSAGRGKGREEGGRAGGGDAGAGAAGAAAASARGWRLPRQRAPPGARTSCMQALSTMTSSYLMLGYFSAIWGQGVASDGAGIGWGARGDRGARRQRRQAVPNAQPQARGRQRRSEPWSTPRPPAHLAAALDEEAVGLLHDVGLVDGRHLGGGKGRPGRGGEERDGWAGRGPRPRARPAKAPRQARGGARCGTPFTLSPLWRPATGTPLPPPPAAPAPCCGRCPGRT
jgi:hypothetical protein